MTKTLQTRAFQLAYREAAEGVAWDAGLTFRLPASNDRLTMAGYLAACEPLYVEVLGMLRVQSHARVLDAGGSFGAFSLALRSLGLAVDDGTPVDDPVDLVIGLALHRQTATAEAVATLGERLKPGGRLVIAVPSSHYWPIRLAELRGRPLATIEEGTVELGTQPCSQRQLWALLRRNGLRPKLIRGLDYSPASIGGPLRQIVAGLMTLAPRHREVWLALAVRDGRP